MDLLVHILNQASIPHSPGITQRGRILSPSSEAPQFRTRPVLVSHGPGALTLENQPQPPREENGAGNGERLAGTAQSRSVPTAVCHSDRKGGSCSGRGGQLWMHLVRTGQGDRSPGYGNPHKEKSNTEYEWRGRRCHRMKSGVLG